MDGPLTLERLSAQRLVAIVRSTGTQHVPVTVETLVDAGVAVLELALTTPGALECLARLAPQLPPSVHLGAGTVTTGEAAAAAIDAGASFLVTPGVALDVLEVAADRGAPVLAGALTPTEVLTVHRAGALAVKVFPAVLGGPGYCAALREPLPDVPLVPTGGVGGRNGRDYLDVGAVALGVGRSLIGDATEGGSQDELRARVATMRAAVGLAPVPTAA